MIARLRELLARTRNRDGGWPYLAGRASRLEPTAWAMLALGDLEAASLLLGWRNATHLLVEPGVGVVTQTFNALAALALAAPAVGRASDGTALAAGLLEHSGVPLPDHPAIKQDSSLKGWSWSDGAFSWAEPTAWCMLAVKKLCRDRSGAKARLEEAERVMRDRACAGGGWNYGNKEVYGQSLLPHVPPTAAGVLAFQDRPDDGLLTDAVRVLRQQAPREGSAAALAVAWLALSAVQSPTADVAEQLGRRIDAAEAVGNLAVLAMLLYVLERIERRERPLPFILTP